MPLDEEAHSIFQGRIDELTDVKFTCKISPGTPLRKLHISYCKHLDVPPCSTAFYHNGIPVDLESSAAAAGLYDGATLQSHTNASLVPIPSVSSDIMAAAPQLLHQLL